MKFKDTLAILKDNTIDIVRLIEMCEKSDELRKIDLDLLLERIRGIYDILIDMRQLENEDMQELQSKEIVPEPKKVTPPQESETELQEKTETESLSDIEIQTSEKEESGQEDDVPETHDNHAVRSEEHVKKAAVGEAFQASRRTLYDEVAKSSGKGGLSEKLNTQRISNLTSALGLNEKFELIKELFSGDKSAFDDAFSKLNSADTYDEAISFLDQEFSWEPDNPHVVKIMELLKRKFGV